MNTFDRLVTYKNFKFELINIHGIMLDFLDEFEADKFLIELGCPDVPLWSNGGSDLSLIEYDEVKEFLPDEVKVSIENILTI